MAEFIGLVVVAIVMGAWGVTIGVTVGIEQGAKECCAAMECPTDMVPRYVDEQCACVAFLGVE